jgi:hypothetical protein
MSSTLEGESGFQAYHILLTREQHRRLRLVCTTLAVPMSEFLRRLISRDVDRRFFKLGLDRVPIPQRAERKPGGARRARADRAAS